MDYFGDRLASFSPESSWFGEHINVAKNLKAIIVFETNLYAMAYKSSLVEVDLLLLCSPIKRDALQLQKALFNDYPKSNNLKQSQVVQSYFSKFYYIMGKAVIDSTNFEKYRRYLKRFKIPDKRLKFEDVQVEIIER